MGEAWGYDLIFMSEKNLLERQIVLGAGASDGFPLGSALLDNIIIIGKLIKDTVFKEGGVYYTNRGTVDAVYLLKEVNKNPLFFETIRDLAFDIEKSCATSIDFYTSRIANKERQKVAEALIGAIIKSYKIDKVATWYGHLLPLVFPENISELSAQEKINKIEEKIAKIRIVTFNYDLSLEKFLYKFLRNNVFYKSEEFEFLQQAKELIFKKINHVYGSIDNPLSCDLEEIEKENYSQNYIKILKDAFENQEKYSQNIKLIEGKRGGGIELINCDYLYILGFGFDLLNIKQIELNKDCWQKNCFITNFDDNQKIKRIALNLLYKHGETYNLPIISKEKIQDALSNDFSLQEISQSERVPSNQRFGNISPYFALKKYQP